MKIIRHAPGYLSETGHKTINESSYEDLVTEQQDSRWVLNKAKSSIEIRRVIGRRTECKKYIVELDIEAALSPSTKNKVRTNNLLRTNVIWCLIAFYSSVCFNSSLFLVFNVLTMTKTSFYLSQRYLESCDI